MSNIIPGVPTPSDPTCALTVCGSIIAQVDCIKYIMQGTSACIDIQFFDSNGTPLDLDRFCDIQIQLTNEFDCVVANFWYPDVPTGSRGFDIEILQYTTTGGHIVNKGLLRICLSASCTLTSPTSIFAEILLKECLLTGEEAILTGVPTPIEHGDSFGIPCLQIAKITESKIAKNGGAGGCFPGYIPPQPGSSGIGFAIGSTGATGVHGSTGATGNQGYVGSTGFIGGTGSTGIGLTGATGDQGFIGSTGNQGDQGFTGATGFIGATGDQGFIGATGNQGDQGFTGATGSTGIDGDQGFTGATGFIGATGNQGDQGFTGATGSQGDQGFIGATGSQGPQGDIGSTGFIGGTGATGSQGDIGSTGLTGSTGPAFSSPFTGPLQVNGQAWTTASANGDTTSTTDVDWDNGNVQTFTLDANPTAFAFSNPNAGATYILIVQQNTLGSYTINWPGTVAWAGGTPPTMTATADRYDIFTFIYDGSKYFGSYIQNFA